MTTTQASLRPIRAILRAMLSPRSRVDDEGRGLLTAIDAEIDQIEVSDEPNDPAEISRLIPRLDSLYEQIRQIAADHRS